MGQAELGVQRGDQPCIQSGYLKDSQKKSLNVTHRLFSFTVCLTLQYVMTRGKFNGYLELHLSSAMAMYYKYALDEKEKQCFLLQIWEGVWESLVKGMSNSGFVNHESTHKIHKLKTEYKW